MYTRGSLMPRRRLAPLRRWALSRPRAIPAAVAMSIVVASYPRSRKSRRPASAIRCRVADRLSSRRPTVGVLTFVETAVRLRPVPAGDRCGPCPAGGATVGSHRLRAETGRARTHPPGPQPPAPPAGLAPADQPLRAAISTPEDALATADRYLHATRAAHDTFDKQVATLLHHRKQLIATYATDRPATDQPGGPAGWTHGDLQHRNVLWHQAHIAAVIDWDRIRIRPFAEEVARTATVQFGSEQGALVLTRTAAFISGYRSVITLSDDDLLDGLHRLWWKRVSDFWHLDFHYNRSDHSFDHLFLTNEEFLHWWTSHRNDVREAFVV
jgi:hypothetical protein